jgi:hypothetical protein
MINNGPYEEADRQLFVQTDDRARLENVTVRFANLRLRRANHGTGLSPSFCHSIQSFVLNAKKEEK